MAQPSPGGDIVASRFRGTAGASGDAGSGRHDRGQHGAEPLQPVGADPADPGQLVRLGERVEQRRDAPGRVGHRGRDGEQDGLRSAGARCVVVEGEAGRLLPSGDGLGPRVDEEPAERRPHVDSAAACARRRPAAPAGTRSKGRASQRSPVACGSWSTARSRGTTSLCSSSAAPRTRANRSTPSRTSPIARSQAPGARSSPAHSVVRAVSDFRSGSGSATVNRGSTGKACPSKAFSRLDPPSTSSCARRHRRVMPRRHRLRLGQQGVDRRRPVVGHRPRHGAVDPQVGRRPQRVGQLLRDPATRRTPPPRASSCAAAYASATAAARVESSASSNRSPTSSWGRARSPAAAGRWVVTRVCAQWANARNAPSPTNRGCPGGRFVQEGHGRRGRGRRSCSEERLAQPLLQLRRLVAPGGLAGEDRREG